MQLQRNCNATAMYMEAKITKENPRHTEKYKKEYLRAKAKYLRELIDQKNDLSSLNEPFYACVYEKWNSGEMPLTEANTMCSLKFEHN